MHLLFSLFLTVCFLFFYYIDIACLAGNLNHPNGFSCSFVLRSVANSGECIILLIMIVLFILLQAIGEDVITESINAMDSSSVSGLSSEQPKTYMVTLATLLIVNVVIMVVNFIFDRIKHSKDNHNHKVRLIAQKGVEVESAVFGRFQKMASLHPGDEHSLLDAILEMDTYISTNRLYIERKFLSCSIEFLDYYKKIQHKMTLKDIKKEESYFEKLSKAFYGE